MEENPWLQSLFKYKVLSTSHLGQELILSEGRFSDIPFTTRWMGWFLSDVEPNYAWNSVLKLLQKEFNKLSIPSLGREDLEILRENIEKALGISYSYQNSAFLKFLSLTSDYYLIDVQWLERGLADVSGRIERVCLQEKKQDIIKNLIFSFSEKDIETPGIFRVSSTKADVETWVAKLLKYPESDVTKLSPHLRATLLKTFLKKLVLFQHDENFIAAGNIDQNKWDRLNRLMLAVQNLPDDSRQILQMVLPLLRKVADVKENDIDAKNLGVCMGQDMLSLEESDDMDKMICSNEALSLLIENQEKILGEE